MTHDELIRSLEAERLDRTFWRLGPSSTTAAAMQRRDAIKAAEEEQAIKERRLSLFAAVGQELCTAGGNDGGNLWRTDNSPPGRNGGARETEQSESSTSIGAA